MNLRDLISSVELLRKHYNTYLMKTTCKFVHSRVSSFIFFYYCDETTIMLSSDYGDMILTYDEPIVSTGHDVVSIYDDGFSGDYLKYFLEDTDFRYATSEHLLTIDSMNDIISDIRNKIEEVEKYIR